MWGKEVSATLVRKETKKRKKNSSLLTCPRMRQWQRRDLRGLRGEAWGRGGGLRTRHVGKRGLCNGQKRNEKTRIWVKGGDEDVHVLNALTRQGWWHTFPRHGLSLHPTWSHVPAQIQRNTVLTVAGSPTPTATKPSWHHTPLHSSADS